MHGGSKVKSNHFAAFLLRSDERKKQRIKIVWFCNYYLYSYSSVARGNPNNEEVKSTKYLGYVYLCVNIFNYFVFCSLALWVNPVCMQISTLSLSSDMADDMCFYVVMQILFRDNRDRSDRKHSVAPTFILFTYSFNLVAHAIHPSKKLFSVLMG